MTPRRTLTATAPRAIALLLGAVLLAGCAAGTGTGATAAPAATGTTTAGTASDGTTGTGAPASAGDAAAVTASVTGTHENESDYAWDASAEIAVTLADGASAGGEGVSVDGDMVTITAAGTYRISGTLGDGRLVVDNTSSKVVRLVLDGVSISSSTGPALSVVAADKVVIILADGSRNTLADAATYELASADVDEPNAALFSAADLTIAGDGALTVTGRYNDGIAGKDGVIVAGGSVTVDAADDGIRGKDYLVVTGGTLDVTAGGDALKSDNAEDATLGYVTVAGGTLDLEAGTDAIDAVSAAMVRAGTMAIAAGDDAIHAETRLEVSGGTIDISRSYEGLEATQIVISGGAVTLVAEDDGLNVAGGVDGSGWQQEGGFPGQGGPGGGGPMNEVAVEGYYVEVSGGTLVIDAGGDGFDSNGSATITGGAIVVNGPLSNGNGAIDVNGDFLVSDAVLVAAGSLGMAETPSASSAQATLHLRFDSLVTAGTVVRIQDPDGTVVATFAASKDFQSLVVSTPDVEPGVAYEVLTGGTASGDDLGGYYPDPAYAGGTVIGTVTAGTR